VNAPFDAGEDGPIPPRTLHHRIRLALYWGLRGRGAVTKDALADGNVAEDFVRELSHAGLKLCWLDGSPISITAWADDRRRETETLDHA
jgi:hypothetical protein